MSEENTVSSTSDDKTQPIAKQGGPDQSAESRTTALSEGRDTMGVVFAKPDQKDSIILVNVFKESEPDDDEADEAGSDDAGDAVVSD